MFMSVAHTSAKNIGETYFSRKGIPSFLQYVGDLFDASTGVVVEM